MRALLALVLLVPLFAQDRQLPYKCGWSQPGGINKVTGMVALSPSDSGKTYITDDSTFAIHYDTTGSQAPPLDSSRPDGIPDWVIQTAEAFMHARELLLQRGYPSPPDDGDSTYDVYIKNYGGGVYGETLFEYSNPAIPIPSYIEIENDFAEDEMYFTHGLPALWTTAAHEYFHAVQLAYGWLYSDLYFYELASTWFEEVANPEINDWIYWFRLATPDADFGSYPERHLNTTDGYSAAIFGHYLTWAAMDASIMQRIWANAPSLIASNGQFIDEVDRQLADRGIDLAEVWVDFVRRLFLNGSVHNSQFHPDQLYLPQPLLYESQEQIVSNETHLTFDELALGTCDITVLLVDEESDLKLSMDFSSGVGAFGANVYYKDIFELDDNNWIGRRLDSNDQVILVVGGDVDEVMILAQRRAPGADVQFTLESLGPNPFGGRGLAPELVLKYKVNEEYTALNHKIVIYNLLGQQVFKYMYRANVLPGITNEITLKLPQLNRLASGVYILTLTLDGRTSEHRTITLIK